MSNSLKFQQQRFNYASSDRIDSTDPQFLTFRTNDNQNTGRSIFSHNIENYKSQQKVQNNEISQQMTPPVRNFKKNNHLRSIKSQQKLQTRSYIPIKKALNFDNTQNDNQQYEGGKSHYQYKNQSLRKKQKKLIKSIKRQAERQLSLESQIQYLERQLEEDDQDIQEKQLEIQQLEAINQENEEYLEKLIEKRYEMSDQNHKLETKIGKLEETLEQILNSSRQQEIKNKGAQKLKQSLIGLQKLKAEVTNRCKRMEKEIQKMKEYIEDVESLELSIRDLTFSRSIQNNSHFTC